MKTAQELLTELNTLDEHLTIEAKTASDVGMSLMETVCAFANEPHLGGGYILLGVAPVSDAFCPVYEAVGVSNSDQMQQEIATQCASMFNIPIRPQIVSERLDDKTLITVFVPEASAHEKPIHFRNQPLPRSARRRIGSTDQKCTDDDMVLFYEERRGETYDEQLVTDASMDDFDEEAIESYRRLRSDVNSQAEELIWSRDDLLEALCAAKRRDGVLKPTVAGVLLFGSSKALRRLFPMLRIDYIRVPGVQWVKDPDRRFDTVEIRAPLLRAFQRVRSAILDDLPKAFSLPAGEVQGKEIPVLPDRVIREVVANAVMHRDYRVHGSIQIIRYSNRLEVRNPGYSIKAEERLGQPGSETRNPKIAAVLHDVNFAETKGSGIRVMRELMDEQGLSSPALQSDRTGNSFLAMLLFHHFLSEEDLVWLKSFEQHNLTEDEMKAMISAREVGALDNSTYRTINREIDTLSASKHLRKLCDCGLLVKKGNGPATYYEPTEQALENWLPGTVSEVKLSLLDGKKQELDSKKQELDGKKQELDGKKQELDSKKQELDGKKQELDSKKQELGSKKQEFDSKKQELDGKKQELDGKKQELDSKKQELGSKKQELDSKKQELGSKKQELDGKKQELGSKKQELDSKKQELDGKKQELDGKKQELDSKKQELDSKKQELDSKKQELDSKKQELDGKKQELDGKKQELPGDLSERIAAQGKKGDKAEILNLVVELLTVREMSTFELATYLDRAIEYVRRTYIKPLVDAGRIQSSNPENPTDPGLKYRPLFKSNRQNESEEAS